MPKSFLFRFDMSIDNDAFMNAFTAQSSLNTGSWYGGVQLMLQRDWIPDFIKVDQDESLSHWSITIIELEKAENDAVASSSKYLTASAQEIISRFRDYLQRVLAVCRPSADPRIKAIQELINELSLAPNIYVWTAGGLRQPPRIVSRHMLIGQDQDSIAHHAFSAIAMEENSKQHMQLSGEQVISALDHKALALSIRLTDAVVNGFDVSSATIKSWRFKYTKGITYRVSKNPAHSPNLLKVLDGNKLGLRINGNDLARELSMLWNESQSGVYSEQLIITVLEELLPIARTLDRFGPVRSGFEHARRILDATRS